MNSLFSVPLETIFKTEGAAAGSSYVLNYDDRIPHVEPGYYDDEFLNQAFTPHSKIGGIDISSFPFMFNDHMVLLELRGKNFSSKSNITVTDIVIAETCNDVRPHINSLYLQSAILESVV